jgi:hypothetical protein
MCCPSRVLSYSSDSISLFGSSKASLVNTVVFTSVPIPSNVHPFISVYSRAVNVPEKAGPTWHQLTQISTSSLRLICISISHSPHPGSSPAT